MDNSQIEEMEVLTSAETDEVSGGVGRIRTF